MTDFKRFAEIIAARTPGYGSVCLHCPPQYCEVLLQKDSGFGEEDLIFVATMGTLADKMLAVIKAADDLRHDYFTPEDVRNERLECLNIALYELFDDD